MRLAKRLLLAVIAVTAVCAFATSSALASSQQVTIMQDNTAINKNPMAALTKMKQAGATMVKYAVYWQYYTPPAGQRSTTIPAGFDPTNPASYNGEFQFLDEVDQDAQKVGLKVGFMVTAPVPRWAEGTNSNCLSSGVEKAFTCEPNVQYFQTFMAALGERYNGSVAGIPAVRWWSIWNEPNYIPNLQPQLTGTNTYSAVDQYRSLLNAGWLGLNATDHTTSSDKILFGELAPRGINGKGKTFNTAGSKPIAFINALYCENQSGKRFTGKTASANNCGSSAPAFKSANPALFNASGFADHPYSQGVPPNQKTGDCVLNGKAGFCRVSKSVKYDNLWTDLASIKNLENVLARDTKTYGDKKNYSIWNTEYGFWTAPPSKKVCKGKTPSYCAVNETTAQLYMNWAEYISYTNPRIASYAQYQLYDPKNIAAAGNWTDGLLTAAGKPKQVYSAYVMPLFLPTTSLKKASSVTVWGGVRPAAYYLAHDKTKAQVAIQFKGKKGGWKTVKTVKLSTSNPASYFSTKVKFSSTGSVRLSYTTGKTTMTSRTQAITVG